VRPSGSETGVRSVERGYNRFNRKSSGNCHETDMFRTNSGEAPDVLTFGPFRVDRTGGVLSRDGQEVALPPKAVSVLLCLLARPGAIVSREDLLGEVWGDAAVTDASLTEAVRTLRQALDDDPQQPLYVQTVHRRGYRFVAEVRREEGKPLVAHPPSDGAGRDTTPAAPASRANLTAMASHGITAIIGITAGVLLATVGTSEPERLSSAEPGPDMYVAEFWNDAIVRLDSSDGSYLGTFAAGDGGGGPGWMACAPNGNLLVTRPHAGEVTEFDNLTGARLGTFASTNLTIPQALVVGGPNNNLFVSNLEPARNVVELDGRTGLFIRTLASINPGQPFAMAFGPNGNLFVAVALTRRMIGGRVEEIDVTTGASVRSYPTPGDVAARDVVFSSDGTFFASAGDTVIEFEIGRREPIRTLASDLNEPHGLRIAPNGHLFVVNSGVPNLLELDVTTGARIQTITSGLLLPVGLLFGRNGSGPCGPM